MIAELPTQPIEEVQHLTDLNDYLSEADARGRDLLTKTYGSHLEKLTLDERLALMQMAAAIAPQVGGCAQLLEQQQHITADCIALGEGFVALSILSFQGILGVIQFIANISKEDYRGGGR